MDHKCPNCGFRDAGHHWNPSSLLPPVSLPIYILVDEQELLVKRDQWAKSKNDDLAYEDLATRNTIYGRYVWRHA